MAKNLFLSESRIGNHIAPDIFEADLLSFTFYPLPYDQETFVESVYDVYPKISYSNIYLNNTPVADTIKKRFGGNVFQYIESEMRKRNYLFVGFDLDLMGQLMSSVLYYYLIGKGVNPERIVRIPLSDEGYVTDSDEYKFAIGDFYDLETLVSLLEAVRVEQKLIWKTPVRQGFKKMEIVRNILENRPESVKKLNDDINTATYLTKVLLQERN